MVEQITNFLTSQICKDNQEIDEERAEAINYGLQLLVGEVPKIFLLILLSIVLGIGKITITAFFLLLPYKAFSGGFHLKTHIGCMISTSCFYIGLAFLGKYLILSETIRGILIGIAWVMGMILVAKYAPADTENFPILVEKERKQKRIISYISLTVDIIVCMILPWRECANALLFMILLQNLFITPVAYKLTKNKYGYEVYGKQEN